MSKAILISIQPKWCHLIANKIKTIEVRKSRPKLETPFKCYIYCTKPKFPHEDFICFFDGRGGFYAGGKVIGEFICDKIFETVLWRVKGNTGFLAKQTAAEASLPECACLTIEELEKYAGGENRCIYGWHISDLVIYDQPKALSEFEKYSEEDLRPCQNGKKCEHQYFDAEENCNACSIDFDGEHCPFLRFSRPPQSWCYVEEVQK